MLHWRHTTFLPRADAGTDKTVRHRKLGQIKRNASDIAPLRRDSKSPESWNFIDLSNWWLNWKSNSGAWPIRRRDPSPERTCKPVATALSDPDSPDQPDVFLLVEGQ